MRRHPRFAILVAATLCFAPEAHAQNFFERLFGIAPSRPQPAPQQAPQVAPADPQQAPEDAKPRTAPVPIQARPVALRVPTEAGILGRDLKQNGFAGSLKIDRPAGGDLSARMTLVGRRGQTADSCTVQINGKLSVQSKPDGLIRYRLEDAGCGMNIDVLDEAVLVKGESCQFQAANCQADASGMWGPDANTLLAKAKDYETIRASADKAARENYKVLTQRARPEAVRPIVAEQAAFSSDREITCRNYAKEAQHSFCNARFSEGRAISLAQRLGVTMASAEAIPGQPGQTRIRVREGGQATPRDPYALPSTNDLVERNPFDQN